MISLEPGNASPSLLRPYPVLSPLLFIPIKKRKKRKEKSPSTSVMNISSNQSNRERKTMFTARENAKVALGCKYKKEKN